MDRKVVTIFTFRTNMTCFSPPLKWHATPNFFDCSPQQEIPAASWRKCSSLPVRRKVCHGGKQTGFHSDISCNSFLSHFLSQPVIVCITFTSFLLEVMEKTNSQSCYGGRFVEHFRFYLKQTKVHDVLLRFLQNILPSTFNRYGDNIGLTWLTVKLFFIDRFTEHSVNTLNCFWQCMFSPFVTGQRGLQKVNAISMFSAWEAVKVCRSVFMERLQCFLTSPGTPKSHRLYVV